MTMGMSNLEFAQAWEAWKVEQNFADTSATAFAEHLEAEHAKAQIAAIRAWYDRDEDVDGEEALFEIGSILETQYGEMIRTPDNTYGTAEPEIIEPSEIPESVEVELREG